jgi:DNA invertase Pin-like site-specific DNA recombinase
VTAPVGLRAIGYARTSTDEQLAGLDAQDSAIRAAVEARGWQLVDVVREQAPGADTDRPGLARALRRARTRHVDVLVVAKLDRLTRSFVHLAQLLDDARTRGWMLVALTGGRGPVHARR